MEPNPLPLPDADTLTIVSGLPRSGTSVMMQMLAAAGLPIAADNVREADSDNPHGYYEDERVKLLARDATWLSEARGKVIKVVAPLIPHLPAYLRYRVIFMERDLDEVLRSQRTMIERLGRQGAQIPPEKLKQAFEQQVRQAKLLLESRSVPVLCVSYSDVMRNGAEVAARVSAFLGGGLDLDAMARAVDLKLGRHRNPGAG